MSDEIIVRFLGDPTGYRVFVPRGDIWQMSNSGVPGCWVRAKIGSTDKEVRIDVSKAYVMHDAEVDW